MNNVCEHSALANNDAYVRFHYTLNQPKHDEAELLAYLKTMSKFSGARLLRYLVRHPGKYHCVKLSHLVFPPDDERYRYLEDLADIDPECGSSAVFSPFIPLVTDTVDKGDELKPGTIDGQAIADMIVTHEYSNPLTDERTIREVRQRMLKLKAALEKHPDDSAATRELESLQKYLRETMRPPNRILNHNPELKRCYQSMWKSVVRVMEVLRIQRPELAELVEQRLRTGVYWAWRRENVKT